MPTVLVLRGSLLPYSETFVKEQVQRLTSWTPVLVGWSQLNDLDLQDVALVELEPSRRGGRGLALRAGRRVSRAASRLSGWHPVINRKLRRLDPDLVHIHFATDAVAFAPLVLALKVPVLVTLHGFDIHTHEEEWRSRPGRFERRYPARLAKLVRNPNVSFIAVSQSIKDAAIDAGIPKHKIEVCYIGIDTERFVPRGSSPTARRVVFTGRMVEKKAPLSLIEAYSIVRRRVPDAVLSLIGDGPLLYAAQERAAALGLDVEFLGKLPPAAVLKVIQSAHVLCLPSVTAANGDAEGFGLVLLEAQSCGVPVVTSARGGAVEGVLDGVTGFRFTEGDIASMAEHLTRLLIDDSLRSEMATSARRFVRERFDIRERIRDLEAIYDRAVASD